MRSSRTALILFVLTLACPPWGHGAAEPTRENLREAWERVQAEDPQTLTFEPTGENTYHFRTERFPFDGTLRLLNLGLGERMPWADAGEYRIGFVEVELVGLREDFGYLYSQSYGHWMQTNTLYWSDSDGRWYSQAEWQERAIGTGACATSWTGWISGSWILLLVFVVALLLWVARRSSRQMSRAMQAQDVALDEQQRAIGLSERAVALGEESNRLLAEILQELRAGRRP